jgi:hypothetical protein
MPEAILMLRLFPVIERLEQLTVGLVLLTQLAIALVVNPASNKVSWKINISKKRDLSMVKKKSETSGDFYALALRLIFDRSASYQTPKEEFMGIHSKKVMLF